MMHKISTRRRAHGLTLLEVGIALALSAVVIAGMSVYATNAAQKMKRRSDAQHLMVVARAAEAYLIKNQGDLLGPSGVLNPTNNSIGYVDEVTVGTLQTDGELSTSVNADFGNNQTLTLLVRAIQNPAVASDPTAPPLILKGLVTAYGPDAQKMTDEQVGQIVSLAGVAGGLINPKIDSHNILGAGGAWSEPVGDWGLAAHPPKQGFAAALVGMSYSAGNNDDGPWLARKVMPGDTTHDFNTMQTDINMTEVGGAASHSILGASSVQASEFVGLDGTGDVTIGRAGIPPGAAFYVGTNNITLQTGMDSGGRIPGTINMTNHGDDPAHSGGLSKNSLSMTNQNTDLQYAFQPTPLGSYDVSELKLGGGEADLNSDSINLNTNAANDALNLNTTGANGTVNLNATGANGAVNLNAMGSNGSVNVKYGSKLVMAQSTGTSPGTTGEQFVLTTLGTGENSSEWQAEEPRIVVRYNKSGAFGDAISMGADNGDHGDDMYVCMGTKYVDGTGCVSQDSGGLTYQVELSVTGDMRLNGQGIKTSDRRLKTDIKPLGANVLNQIDRLNGYYFKWKRNGHSDIGVIAQEVEKVFPDIVSAGPDGMLGVEYSNLVAPLIEAVKELHHMLNDSIALFKQQIAALQQDDHALQAQVQTLSEQNAALKAELARQHLDLVQLKYAIHQPLSTADRALCGAACAP